MKRDIVFLHAPSVYDFRKKPIFYGPVSDVIPSSPVFEMYPIGFMTICAELMEAGFSTRILNIAVRMLQSDSFDAEECIRKIDADVFAIDLHWMPHAHGALELAKIVKKHHPDAKVELGGFTSSYFWEELIQRPEVDLVMRGDTTEVPTVMMMEALQREGDLSQVPNLVWKDDDGKVHDNGLTYSLDSLDSVKFDYGVMIKNVMRNMDIKGALPWYGWDKLPLTSVFTVRGCTINCAECGGSHFANGNVVCRKKPAFRSPEKLAEDISVIQSYLDTPIFIVGDLRQHSAGYAQRFLKECRDRGVKNHVVIELFNGAGMEYFNDVDRTFENGWSIEFSPDSHDEKVRSVLGKGYTNQAIEQTIPTAFECGCSRFDLFYMNGLPYQDRESAMDSARVAKKLWASVKQEDKLFIYNAPFAPFVDPGSRIFENPSEWGYTLRARTLEEHRRLLDNPSWKHVLSYETKWMSRDDVAEISYDAALELARCEYEAGRATKESYESRVDRTQKARDLMHRIDEIMLIKDPAEREARLWETKDEGTRMMNSTIANKNDLDWDAGSIWANGPRVVCGLVKSFFRHRSSGHAARFLNRGIHCSDHRGAEPEILRGTHALDRRSGGRAHLVPEDVGMLPGLQHHLGGSEHALGREADGILPRKPVQDACIGHGVDDEIEECRRAPREARDDIHLVLGDLDGESDGSENGGDVRRLLWGQRPVRRVAHGAFENRDAVVGHDPHDLGVWHICFQFVDGESCDQAEDGGPLLHPRPLVDEHMGYLLRLDGEDGELRLGGDLGSRREHADPVCLAHVVASPLAGCACDDLVLRVDILRYEPRDEGLRHLPGPDEADPCSHARSIPYVVEKTSSGSQRRRWSRTNIENLSFPNIYGKARTTWPFYTSISCARTMSLVAFYMPLAIVAVIALGFAPLAWWASRFIRPKKPTQWMESTYECGSEPIGEAQVQFRFQYYTFALIFVVFDLVATFLMIWAVAFSGLSTTAQTMMIAFFAILILGVCYSLKKEENVWI